MNRRIDIGPKKSEACPAPTLSLGSYISATGLTHPFQLPLNSAVRCGMTKAVLGRGCVRGRDGVALVEAGLCGKGMTRAKGKARSREREREREEKWVNEGELDGGWQREGHTRDGDWILWVGAYRELSP